MRVPLPGSILRAVARTAVARSPGFYGKADRGGPKNVPVAPPTEGERAVDLAEGADCALRTGEGAVGPTQDSQGGTGTGTLRRSPRRAPW